MCLKDQYYKYRDLVSELEKELLCHQVEYNTKCRLVTTHYKAYKTLEMTIPGNNPDLPDLLTLKNAVDTARKEREFVNRIVRETSERLEEAKSKFDEVDSKLTVLHQARKAQEAAKAQKADKVRKVVQAWKAQKAKVREVVKAWKKKKAKEAAEAEKAKKKAKKAKEADEAYQSWIRKVQASCRK